MNTYEVELTETAFAAIANHAHYIAIDCHAPVNAMRWLTSVWDAIHSLEQFPERGALAHDNEYASYEVRRLVVGSHLLLFTKDDARRTVWIVGLRHGHRIPRQGELPESPFDS